MKINFLQLIIMKNDLKTVVPLRDPLANSAPLASELTHHKNEHEMPNAQF